MTVPFLDLKAGLAELARPLADAHARVMASGHAILGPELAAFEAEFAAYCGAAHCVGVGNGLDALALALRARGIGPGDEVIVPAQTFVATWLAVEMAGARPVGADVEPGTCLIDPAAVAAAIGPRTAAILPVHLYGAPAPMASLRALADRHGLFLLEDAAQAHGARLAGARTGALGHAAAFSFYPSKNLGAFGDGGAVVTDDAALAERLRRLRNYGSSVKYVHDEVGVNSRLDEIQAAHLRAKLPALDAWNDRRRALADLYDARLEGVAPLARPADAACVHHLYVVTADDRDAFAAGLAARGVQTLVHYPIPPHRQKAFAHLALAEGTFPHAERFARTCLSLPIGPHLAHADAARVIEAVADLAHAGAEAPRAARA